ncbi:hypothetical protein ED733_004222 [Metarhizium rileyi]|uniref:AB hydrolase-1 domain-containing protein n=1 Tax=Metarhizium rileyi (strain RCEF 4871) TaxID=1649241 RepID=A0A5C6G4N5_METRR|nr:hypothetical protein ED733_004222 [Metarhizium rileyi]
MSYILLGVPLEQKGLAATLPDMASSEAESFTVVDSPSPATRRPIVESQLPFLREKMHKLFPGSGFFDFEAIRILGTAVYGGADVAEVLEAVGQIKPGDPVSWEKAWRTQALRAEELADEAHRTGDRDAARRGYLRAANYTRASGYMYLPASLDKKEFLDQDPCAIAEKVSALFRRALPLMDGKVHRLSIPYDEHCLPGYLYLPSVDRKLKGSKTPVLINCGGADSCQEELYFLNPAAGPGMGYAVITFDGPGQGLMLKQYEVTMRPDWERVVAQVIDYLVGFSSQHPELDLDMARIAVSGASMGGYFALRAAAEPRVKACVSIDPFYDMWDFGTAHVSPFFISAWSRGWIGDSFVDRIMGWLSAVSFQLKWEISITGALFGLSSPAAILQHMKKFTLAGGKDGADFLSRVTCPVLVSGAGQSLYMDVGSHTRRCFEALTNVPLRDKQIWVPASEGQGSLQAKMGALALCNQRTYQFLDKAFGIARDPLA